MRCNGILIFLALSACADTGIYKPSLRASDRQEYTGNAPISGVTPSGFEFSDVPAWFRDTRAGPFSFDAVPLCSIGGVIIAESSGLSFSCSGSAGGTMHLPPVSSLNALDAFRQLVLASGGTFTIHDSLVTVTVPNTDADQGSMFGADLGSGRFLPVLDDEAPPAFAASQLVSLVPLPAGVRPDDARQLLDDLGITARFVRSGSSHFLAGRDESTLNALIPLLSRSAETSSFFAVSGGQVPVLSDIVAQHGLTSTPTAGGLVVHGGSLAVAQVADQFARVSSLASDFRVSAAVLSFDRGSSDDFSAAFSGVIDRQAFALKFGAAETSAPVVAVVAAAVSRFSAISEIRPELTVTAGEPARFVSGRSVPIQQVNLIEGQSVVSSEYRDVGSVVTVTVNPLADGRLRVSVTVELSAVGSQGPAPEFETQTISTTVTVYDGDTVILSGLSAGENSTRRAGGFSLGSAKNARDRQLQIVLHVTRDN